MPLLEQKAVKVTTILAEDVQKKIFKDLSEGNFNVAGSSSELELPSEFYSESVELLLDSGFEISITDLKKVR